MFEQYAFFLPSPFIIIKQNALSQEMHHFNISNLETYILTHIGIVFPVLAGL